MPALNVDGEKLNYHHHRDAARSQRPPLLLIHGAGGNLMHWPGELRRLPDHEVYALDLPGHGHSGGQGRTTISAYVEVVRAFSDALALPQFVLGGHSMGGGIALEFALRYGRRLAGLALIGTGATLPVTPPILSGVLTDFAGTAALLADWAHGEQPDLNLHHTYLRRLREINPTVLHGDFLACNAFDRRADIATLTLPALILCGAADRMTPVTNSQFLAAQMPGARLTIIPTAGHMAMTEPSSTHIVVAAIREFLDRL